MQKQQRIIFLCYDSPSLEYLFFMTNDIYRKDSFDIVIIGGGVVGLALARALNDTPLKIAILESDVPNFEWDPTHYDQRVSAINLASLNFFIELGIWSAIEQERMSTYDKMFIWTEKSELEFTANEVNKPELGFIIENRVIRKVLWEKLATQTNIKFLVTRKLQSVIISETVAQLITTAGERLSAKLLIGADGANSWLRQQLQLAIKKNSYEQSALVTTVQTELPHQHTAWQHFLATGPLAFLPLADQQHCSIVWTNPPDTAEFLQNCSEAEFNAQLDLAFDKLGKVSVIDRRLTFPLNKQHLEQYVQHRVAFIGDAAHTIHPLAGQGVNLGFRDACCLAQVILKSLADKKDYSSYSILRKYERERKADNMVFLTAMDVLKYLFADLPEKLITSRDQGVNMLNKSQFLKKLFIQRALGDV